MGFHEAPRADLKGTGLMDILDKQYKLGRAAPWMGGCRRRRRRR